MGFKNRIGILLKSQFNYWVKQAEDPEKIIDQAVEEMNDGLDGARAKLAALRLRADEERRFLQRIGEQISYWRDKAEGFVKDGMNENAKDAVRKRRMLEEEERRLKIRLEEDEVKLKEMEVLLKELENRVQTAKAKRNILIKNMRLRKGVKRETRRGEMFEGTEVEGSFAMFRKMEERVEEETELAYLKQTKEKEAWEEEERLVKEEIEMIKRNINKGGKEK